MFLYVMWWVTDVLVFDDRNEKRISEQTDGKKHRQTALLISDLLLSYLKQQKDSDFKWKH